LEWPKPPPRDAPVEVDFDFVTDRIATGGGIWTRKDVDRLAAAGITHIVTTADEQVAHVAALVEGRMTWLGNGTLDDGTWKPVVWFANTIAFTEAALRDPAAKVYLHCWSGKNRGPTAAYTALRVTGMSPHEAEDAIRRARPKVQLLYRPDAEQALERMGLA
jgi:protein-tyrosine phosphatase